MSDPARQILEEDAAYVAARLTQGEIAALAGQHVLITGAAGFLPGAIVDALLHLNAGPLADRPMTLTLLGRSLAKLAARHPAVGHDPRVSVLIQDVAEPLPPLPPIGFVIHAASPAAPQRFMSDPAGLLAANTTGLAQLCARAHEDGSRGLLYFSSSEVYGSPAPDQIPTPEEVVGTVDWRQPRAVYAEAKRAGEAIALAWQRQHGVPVRIVRPFHVHGPGLDIDDGRIVGAMIRRGLNQAPFELESDGRATRTYGYVSDATIGFLKAMLSDQMGGIWNIGTDTPETSILELATVIARLFGITDAVKVRPVAAGAGSPNRARPDLTRMREELRWSPQIGLEEGLARTVAWNRAHAETPAAAVDTSSEVAIARQTLSPIPDLLAGHGGGRLGRDPYWSMMQAHHRTLADAAVLVRGSVAGVAVSADGTRVRLANGLTLRLNAGDIRGAAAHVLNHGDYEPLELAAFRAGVAETGGRVVDIGANAGWYSLHAALDPGARKAGVVAFEPVPDTRAILVDNLIANGLSGIVEVRDCALGAADGSLTLHIPAVTGSVAASSRPLFPDQPNRTVSVPVTTLDRALDDGGAVGLIKADVEGAELFVLKGAGRVLAKDRPVLMLELLRKWAAVHGYHPNDVLNLLSRYGYAVLAMTPEGLLETPEIGPDTRPTNFLCLIPGHHDAVRSAIDQALAQAGRAG